MYLYLVDKTLAEIKIEMQNYKSRQGLIVA